MSAKMASEEDLEDAAFRALLAPLAAEVLPGHASPEAATTGPVPPTPAVPSDGVAAPATGAPTSSPAAMPTDQRVTPDAVPLNDGGTRQPAPSSQPASSASERSPEYWGGPPATTPSQFSPFASEIVPEEWPIPLFDAADFPVPLAPDDGSVAERPAFDPLPSGLLPGGRWRLTTTLPGYATPSRSAMPQAGTTSRDPLLSFSIQSRPEGLAYRMPLTSGVDGATRPTVGPRLVARAGAAKEVALPAGTLPRPVNMALMPPARVRWSVVLLSGLASALTVAALSWLFTPALPADASVVPTVPSGTVSAVPTQGAPGAHVPPAVSVPPSSAATKPERDAIASPVLSGEATSSQPAAPPSGSAQDATRTHDQSTASTQDMIALLTQRGDAALAVGDIIAARLLYERAAILGSATAATAVGKTYDKDFLLRADTHGIRPDPSEAAAWYRKAAVLGDPQARLLLSHIDGGSRP